jgi:phage gp45-like
MKEIKKAVDRAIKNIRISTKGIITSIITNKDNVIHAQISDEEEIRDIKIMSHYGFYSLPLPGQTAQLLFNNSSKKVSFIGVEQKPPIEINPGETIIYSKDGSHILLKNGNIYIKGDLIVDGEIIQGGDL